jgi:hypothetical protein
MSYRLFKIIDRRLGWILTIAALLFFGGCGDFFAQKPTELQSQVILNELRDVEENPNVDNPLSEVYRRPAERIEVSHSGPTPIRATLSSKPPRPSSNAQG